MLLLTRMDVQEAVDLEAKEAREEVLRAVRAVQSVVKENLPY